MLYQCRTLPILQSCFNTVSCKLFSIQSNPVTPAFLYNSLSLEGLAPRSLTRTVFLKQASHDTFEPNNRSANCFIRVVISVRIEASSLMMNYRKRWFSTFVLHDPALLHIALAHSAGHLGILLKQGDPDEALLHRT